MHNLNAFLLSSVTLSGALREGEVACVHVRARDSSVPQCWKLCCLSDVTAFILKWSGCWAPNLLLDAEWTQNQQPKPNRYTTDRVCVFVRNLCWRCSGEEYFRIINIVLRSRIPKEECSSSASRTWNQSFKYALFLLQSHTHQHKTTNERTHTFLLPHTCTVIHRHNFGKTFGSLSHKNRFEAQNDLNMESRANKNPALTENYHSNRPDRGRV